MWNLNKFSIPAFSKPDAHSCGSTRISPVPGWSLCINIDPWPTQGILCVSVISWSINFRLATFPSMSSSLLMSFMELVLLDNGYLAFTGTFIGVCHPSLGVNSLCEKLLVVGVEVLATSSTSTSATGHFGCFFTCGWMTLPLSVVPFYLCDGLLD
jgi:hypothetical protein